MASYLTTLTFVKKYLLYEGLFPVIGRLERRHDSSCESGRIMGDARSLQIALKTLTIGLAPRHKKVPNETRHRAHEGTAWLGNHEYTATVAYAALEF
jgi:hypothetical protein